MHPLQGISARYAIFIASILLGAMGLVLALAGYFVFAGTNELRQELTASFSSVQDTYDVQALRASSGYLGDRLFDPLYNLDLTALEEEIARIDAWLSPRSVLILDAAGRVITDGSADNPDHGRRYGIPGELVPGQALIQDGAAGRLVYFTIGHGQEIAGYARVLLSDARHLSLLAALRTEVEDAWRGFVDRFVAIAFVSLLVTILVSLAIGLRLSVSLSRPLRDMSRVVEQYAAGNLAQKLPERSQDELGRLARSLNQMASEHERARDQLLRLANYDELTGLPNRHLFYDRLRRAIGRARRARRQVALFFLDLDRFKAINDTLGHDVGDDLLRRVAGRLRQVIRAEDTLARMGGDEFTLIVEGVCDEFALQTIAQKMIGALAPPFAIGERPFHISVSVGIAIYPRDADALDTLLKHADTAMYAAKGQGPGSSRFFTLELQQLVHERLELEQAMRRAIDRQEFELHYQPEVRADDGRLVAVEALLRWRDGDSLRPPSSFIGALEESGLIAQLTPWVLREAGMALRDLQRQGLTDLRMCVNLSARQFQQPDLPDLIEQVLAGCDLQPERFELEITESTLLDDTLSQSNASRLAERGVRLAIDDFGTGYSSLTYLKRFDVDVLKIDGSFVRDMLEDQEDAQIVAAVLALAVGLGIESVAERVESPAQMERLSALGCDLIQGYLVCRPLGLQDLADWARQYAPGQPLAVRGSDPG